MTEKHHGKKVNMEHVLFITMFGKFGYFNLLVKNFGLISVCQNIWLPCFPTEKIIMRENEIFPSSFFQIMVGSRKTYLACFHTSHSLC